MLSTGTKVKLKNVINSYTYAHTVGHNLTLPGHVERFQLSVGIFTFAKAHIIGSQITSPSLCCSEMEGEKKMRLSCSEQDALCETMFRLYVLFFYQIYFALHNVQNKKALLKVTQGIGNGSYYRDISCTLATDSFTDSYSIDFFLVRLLF